MPYVEIENPRGFDPKIDMESEIMQPSSECLIDIKVIKDNQSTCLIYMDVSSKYETTTVKLNKEKAVKLATRLLEEAKKLTV
jgi:hypothetical protein